MTNILLTEDELLIRNTVRDFSDQALAPRAAKYDANEEFPLDNIKGLAELGLFGLTIDESYGGGGGSTRQLAIVSEEIARGCAATSVIYIAHLALCSQFIHTFGNEMQKRKYLPDLCSAGKIGAFALTEPEAGSDAAGMKTAATIKGDNYIINGTKHFITNAPDADIFILLATQDHKLRSKAVDAIIVEKGVKGMKVEPMHGKMGIRASSVGEVTFEECLVRVENRVGEDRNGFKETMEMLNLSRIYIAAQAVGIAQASYEAAISYAKYRQAFGTKLSDFQGIRWMLSDMATNIEAARLLVHKAASLKDNGLPFVTEASMAKLFASRIAVQSADKALQIHGGIGYFAPTSVERYYRDAKVTEIYEGSSEIQKLIISRNVLG